MLITSFLFIELINLTKIEILIRLMIFNILLMFGILTLNKDKSETLSIIDIDNNNIYEIDEIVLNNKTKIGNLKVTEENIFIDSRITNKNKSSYITEPSINNIEFYKYDNGFKKCDYGMYNYLEHYDSFYRRVYRGTLTTYIFDYAFYSIVIIRNYNSHTKIIITDKDMCCIIDSFNFTEKNIYVSDPFYDDYGINIIVCENSENENIFVKVISVNIYEKIEEKTLSKAQIDYKKIAIRAISHNNFILYCFDDYECIYDYIKNKIIGKRNMNSRKVTGFVKLNEKEKNWYDKNMEYKKIDEDITIKIGDEEYIVHKKCLIDNSEYFKSLFSNNFCEKNEIEFDYEPHIVRFVLRYMYLGKFSNKRGLCPIQESIEFGYDDCIKIYEFCDFILYYDLKNKVHDYILKIYSAKMISEIYCRIKYKEQLEYISDKIKIIRFDKIFNENIDGLIKEGIEELIFGCDFEGDINILPNSIKKIQIRNDWKGKFGDKILDDIEIVRNKHPIFLKNYYNDYYLFRFNHHYTKKEEQKQISEDFVTSENYMSYVKNVNCTNRLSDDGRLFLKKYTDNDSDAEFICSYGYLYESQVLK